MEARDALTQLEQWDHWLFRKINSDWATDLGDSFFPVLTNLINSPWFVMGVLPALLFFWIYRDRGRAIKRILLVALLAGLCDGLSYRVLKPFFGRDRPNHISELQAEVRVSYRPKSHSFPSNHALTSFALASLLGLFFSQFRLGFLVLAGLIAYSRPYVGVHFPSDVFFSGLMGVGIFYTIFWGYGVFSRKLKSQTQ